MLVLRFFMRWSASNALFSSETATGSTKVNGHSMIALPSCSPKSRIDFVIRILTHLPRLSQIGMREWPLLLIFWMRPSSTVAPRSIVNMSRIMMSLMRCFIRLMAPVVILISWPDSSFSWDLRKATRMFLLKCFSLCPTITSSTFAIG